MSEGVIKTTVYLSETEYRRLKSLAEQQDRPAAELVREAVAEYAARHAPKRRLPRSLGAARTKRGNVAARAETLLRGMGRKK